MISGSSARASEDASITSGGHLVPDELTVFYVNSSNLGSEEISSSSWDARNCRRSFPPGGRAVGWVGYEDSDLGRELDSDTNCRRN